MTFSDSIAACFNKYADFTGCASKSEFWWFLLFCLVVHAALHLTGHLLPSIFTLATIVPLAAAGARRLHDTQRSGWMQLLLLIPVIGWIMLLVLYAGPGIRPNRFDGQTPAS